MGLPNTKLMLVVAVLVALLLPCQCAYSCDHEYFVNSQSGIDDPTCGCTYPCLSLGYLVRKLPCCGVKIIIEGPLLEMDTLVVFLNFQNVTLAGENSSVIVRCTPRNGTKSMDAGLSFRSVQNLSIIDLTFEHCGALQNSTSANVSSGSTMTFKSAIYVLNCTDVNIIGVTVSNSNGTGIAFFDTNGTVVVSHSIFEQNNVSHLDSSLPGGGGLYVEFTYCTPGARDNCFHSTSDNQNSTYLVQNCTFVGNNASTLHPDATSYIRAKGSDFQGLGRGGGLCIIFKGNITGTKFNVSDCTFHGNSAIWGGGLFIQFQDFPKDNSVTVTDSDFIENDGYVNGGGGADIGYIFYPRKKSDDRKVKHNNVTFKDCQFHRNKAVKYGGGVALFSSRGFYHSALTNIMTFENCHWVENSAFAAAAVDISPHVWDTLGVGLLPTFTFTNCSFKSNYIKGRERSLGSGADQNSAGLGIFLVSVFEVKFEGNTEFIDNRGTALCLTSAVTEFSEGSSVLFSNNSAVRGGALALIAYSVVNIYENSEFEFVNNTAVSKGGVIYTHSVDKHEYLSSRSCFIQYRGELSLNERNITLTFRENSASTGDGHCIFADSLLPCSQACSINGSKPPPVSRAFDCIGTLIGQESSSGYNVTTIARNFSVNESLPRDVVPGRVFTLPVIAYDELVQKKTGVVYQAILPKDSPISIDVSFSHVSNNRIQLYGQEGDTGNLMLEKGDVSVSLDINVTECPPGFTLYATASNLSTCECAASTYFGIWKCNYTTAFLSSGFWIGYCSDEDTTALCTAHCPLGFCIYNDTNTSSVYPLPAHSSLLDSFVCGQTRTGVLCGKCRTNYSVYFHSYIYKCGANHLCNIGWLLYIISELLPLTIVFLVIILLNIRFTSGSVNGFILFAQVMDSLSIDANGAIQFPAAINFLTHCHRFIYRFFNLDFFSTNGLSFCLWEGATVLDAMAMKYVTIVYAFVLVCCTVFALNNWRCRRLFPCLQQRTLKGAVIHGLSAFFVMCYAQCTRVSFQILSSMYLYKGNEIYQKVVFRSGELRPFQGEHLKYAIPALLFHLTLVMVPPILLLVYPLLCKLLGTCRLSESWIANKLTSHIPLQLLDTFQGCFQDNMRFFAGLYFLYRMFALAAYAFANGFPQFYTFVELQLIIILMLHAVAQPYKKRWHNVVDTLIFADLALINGFTLFNYVKVTTGKEGQQSIQNVVVITSSIQFILIILPLLYIVIYATVRLVENLKIWRNEHTKDTEKEVLTDSGSLPPLRDSREELIDSFISPTNQHAYQRFKDE